MTPAARRENEARLLKAMELEDAALAGGVRAADLASPDVRASLLAVVSALRGRTTTASEMTWDTLRALLADRRGDCYDCASAGVYRRLCHAGRCD